jgi:predicted nucleic acid-binding protein
LKRIVIDNSVVIAWVLEEGDDIANTIVGSLSEVSAVAPAIWPLEFANTLLVAERRKRISEAETQRARDIGMALGIVVVPDHAPRVLTEVLSLARLHGLTAYDASCLDLAIREGVPLATLDTRLADAARRAGVALYSP